MAGLRQEGIQGIVAAEGNRGDTERVGDAGKPDIAGLGRVRIGGNAEDQLGRAIVGRRHAAQPVGIAPVIENPGGGACPGVRHRGGVQQRNCGQKQAEQRAAQGADVHGGYLMQIAGIRKGKTRLKPVPPAEGARPWQHREPAQWFYRAGGSYRGQTA